MKAVYAKRLLKLADFLYELPKQKFNYGVFVQQGGKPMMEALAAGRKDCGTKACAVGWMPAVFPHQVKWGKYSDGEVMNVCLRGDDYTENFSVAEQFFGLSPYDARLLFDPGYTDAVDLDVNATPKRVAKHIRKFVREKQKAAA